MRHDVTIIDLLPVVQSIQQMTFFPWSHGVDLSSSSTPLTFLPASAAAMMAPEPPSVGDTARDVLSEGLLELLKPGVREVDQQVQAVRESQVELREQIDRLAAELCRINEEQKVSLDLDPYVKKLLNARRRVVLVSNILQNAQERLRRLNHSVAKETARRKTYLESGIYLSGSPCK
ncbi:SNARE-associated protein Snapin [Narcine bancroftii]|uniref:SNARE-associated protein Snapin n=1 Tax=Narcine bancroftii TaxID=1343680 RepID=UPI003831728B